MPSNEYIFIFLPHPTPDLFSPSKIESHTNANFLRVKFPRKVIQVLIAKCQIITYTHTTTTTTMPTPEGAGNNFLCLKFQYSQAKQNGRMKAPPPTHTATPFISSSKHLLWKENAEPLRAERGLV